MTIENIEKMVYESAESINEIVAKDNYTKTDFINVQYACGKIHACIGILEHEDMDRFVSLYEEVRDTLENGIKMVDNIYK